MVLARRMLDAPLLAGFATRPELAWRCRDPTGIRVLVVAALVPSDRGRLAARTGLAVVPW